MWQNRNYVAKLNGKIQSASFFVRSQNTKIILVELGVGPIPSGEGGEEW